MRDTGRMWKPALFALCLFVACGAGAGAGALQGQPLLQRFDVEHHDADPSNHDLLSLPDGSLLVANGRGVLHFDGSHWSLHELPGVSPARALYRGRDGQLYVGGYDQFGRLDIDPSGAFRYVDLRGEFGVEGERATFGVIWEAVGTSRGVFFRSDAQLFFLGYQGERETWPLGEDFRRLFAIDDTLYTRRAGVGLGRLGADGFHLLPGGERFADRPLSMLFAHPEGLLLVNEDGWFLAEARGIRALPDSAGTGWKGHVPNAGLRLRDGSYLLGTEAGDLLQFNPDLSLRGVHELGTFSVLDLAVDREGGVWVATEGDLLRLRMPSPWSAFSANDGLAGSLYETAFSDGTLWVGTSLGVYRSVPHEGRIRFEPAIQTALEASSLLAVEGGLLIGDREGVLWHHGQPRRSDRIAELASVFDLLGSAHDPDRVYALGSLEIVVLERATGQWQERARWPLDGLGVGQILEDGPRALWLDNWRGAPQRWELDAKGTSVQSRMSYGAERGLAVDPALGTVLYRFDRTLFAVSGERSFRLDGDTFREHRQAPFSLFDRPYAIDVSETRHGSFAYDARQLYRRLPGTEDWQLAALGSRLARGYFGMQEDADGKLRIKTWAGLLQFDPEIDEPPLVPLSVSLSSWSLRRTDDSIEPLPLANAPALRIRSGDSLNFDYRMVTMEPGVELRFRVVGLDSRWSPWTPPSRPALSLRSLPPGHYRLEVEGRTRSGRVGEPLQHAFEVLPSWWQTRAAKLGLLALLLLSVLLGAQLLARLRYRQYVAANRALEQRIAERTAELEQANRKLAELATEDSLTGVANRRALEQALNREWARCGEQQLPLALIMIDVDHFKQFNDDHGHLAGDRQLAAVARTLADQVRPVRELLARFGGEEFAVVLPGTPLDEAMQRAESMRAAFDDGRFPTTVSIGVAALTPGAEGSPTDLLRDADNALYAAKRQGRNRVVAATR